MPVLHYLLIITAVVVGAAVDHRHQGLLATEVQVLEAVEVVGAAQLLL